MTNLAGYGRSYLIGFASCVGVIAIIFTAILRGINGRSA